MPSRRDRLLDVKSAIGERSLSFGRGTRVGAVDPCGARDETRDLCIARARQALREFDISGVPTTRDAVFEILGSDEFTSGEYSTTFIDEAGAKLPALAGA